MKSNFLLKYMITSFLLSRGQPSQKYQIKNDSLETLALQIALNDIQNEESQVPKSENKIDSFSLFLKALYEDYDLDKAIQLIDQMAIEANDDVLLRKYVFDIK